MNRHFQWILDLKRDTEWQKKGSPINLTDESPLVAGTRISSISFWMDVNGGLTMKSSDHFVIFLFTFPFAYESELSTFLETKKSSQIWLDFPCRQEHRIIEPWRFLRYVKTTPDLGGFGTNWIYLLTQKIKVNPGC